MVFVARASTAFAADPACVQTKQWIEANRTHLPQTYDEFVKLPIAYQSAVFDALPADTKSELWRTHLTRYLEQHPSLDKAKVKLIDQALDFINQPMTFETPHSDPLWDVLVGQHAKGLEKKFRSLFGDEAAAIVSRLARENQSSMPIMEVDATGLKAVLQCSCSTASDYCSPSPYRCYTNNPTCSQTSGCGTFFIYTCNGTCQNRS
jgi:hypothetical protein